MNAQSSYASSTNACKLCTPLGAALAFHGIEGTISLLHGSQGCSTYIRRYLISHYKEPLDIASTNFSEETAIWGGRENLKRALVNLKKQYEPQLVGVATTCLSETIGDDVSLYLKELQGELERGEIPQVVAVSTASYRGTHAEGYQSAVYELIRAFAQPGEPLDQVNVFAPMVSTADVRWLKQTLEAMRVVAVVAPDNTETLDGGLWERYETLPPGGTPLSALRTVARSRASIEFTRVGDEATSPALWLEATHAVAALRLAYPIGIRATDVLLETLGEFSESGIPKSEKKARARLADAYADGHKYVFEKKAVIYGEEDFVVALCQFLAEVGIVPCVVASGGHSGRLAEAVRSLFSNVEENAIEILDDVDFVRIEEAAKRASADFLLGHSKGYKLSQSLGIPLVRVGFPIHDRVGGPRLLLWGYEGTLALFDRIVNALIERNQAANPVGYTYM